MFFWAVGKSTYKLRLPGPNILPLTACGYLETLLTTLPLVKKGFYSSSLRIVVRLSELINRKNLAQRKPFTSLLELFLLAFFFCAMDPHCHIFRIFHGAHTNLINLSHKHIGKTYLALTYLTLKHKKKHP